MAKVEEAKENKSLGKTEIRSCKCTHKWMDTKYGKGQRVHNISKKGPRCCVCKKEK